MHGGERIPVTLITGFLGSGKTTLLNRLLRDPEFRNSAVLVNEFGAVGIDHQLIASAKDRVLLLDSGCLCCVLADSLRETLADLYHRRSQGTVPLFDRVLIETSGLANPGPILQSLLKDALISPLFSLGAVVCVVDAQHALLQFQESVEAREQVAFADKLLVSKLDLGAGELSNLLRAGLAALNPHAPIFPVPAATQPLAPLLRRPPASEFAAQRTMHAADDHENDVDGNVDQALSDHVNHSNDIVSFSVRLEAPVSWPGIAAWSGHLTARFGDDLLRCKALLRLQGRPGRVVVQGVRRVFDIRHDATLLLEDDRSPIVIIGRKLDREALQRGLDWLQAPEGAQQFVSAGFAPWSEVAPALSPVLSATPRVAS